MSATEGDDVVSATAARWQDGEKKASRQLAGGEGAVFEDADAFLDFLKSVPTYQRLPRFDQDWQSLDRGQ